MRVQLRGTESLNLAEVQVFNGSFINLARGQTATATQSSELGAFGDCTGANTATADKAVDGNISGNFADCSVAHTNLQAQPWWQVDLGAGRTTIDRIVLWNRTDACCSARLSNFDVLVSGDGNTFTSIYYRSAAAPRPLEIAVGARYVRVQLRQREALNLAEVQVFQGSTNLALDGAATQSSELGAFGDCTGANTATADKAVDDNTNGNFAVCSVSHTNTEDQPYWQVDLGSPESFDLIVLWNRTDCCATRLSDFKVLLSTDGVTFTPIHYQLAAAPTTLEIASFAPLRSNVGLSVLSYREEGSSVVISFGSPPFDRFSISPTAFVANTITFVTLSATAADSAASVSINSEATTSKRVNLNVGLNTITVVVTAQDGTTTKTYTVTVTRAQSSNANLSSLPIDEVIPSGFRSVTLIPTFSPDVIDYDATVASTTQFVFARATPEDSTATLTMNGLDFLGIFPEMSVGSNLITVVVTAQDGTTTKTYTVDVLRPSTNANLSALSLSPGTLTPQLDIIRTDYTATVANATTSVTVGATTANNAASVTVGATTANNAASVTINGGTSLNVGENTITVVVTAEDGTTKTYTVIVTRAASNNANLSALTLSAGTVTPALTPAFDADTTSYTTDLDYAFTSVSVSSTAVSSTASVSIAGISGAARAVPLNRP